MSAAKKLRALEVTGPFVEAGFMPPQTAEKLRRMHDALPQIVAVIEAAENSVRNGQLVCDEEIELDRVLAALEEAIG